MKIARIAVIIGSIIFGAASGALWCKFGDFHIEPVFGRNMTWFIFPVVLSLIFSLILFFLNSKKVTAGRIVDSFLFLVLYYIFFWTPIYVIVVACLFYGPM